MVTEKPKKKYVLAKDDGLKIPGVPLVITNDNVNNPDIIMIVSKAEAASGRRYFGTSIIEK